MKKLVLGFLVCLMFMGTAVAEDGWTLTQYSDLSGNQAMCYSLASGEDLVLIDGGWMENAPRVKEIIEANGGHVTAWFLTHYHGDHASAFNALWEEYKDKIDVVYCTPLVWDDFIAEAQYWDTPETFETFLKITEGDPKIVQLHRGDQFELAGLKISVFNSYDKLSKRYGDIPNNCSLAFKISASEQSVLFLGDMHNEELGREILSMFGEDALHADYVQSAHHGNHAQSYGFFLAVKPSVVFLDGPEWLMTGDDYKAKEFLVWCEQQGFITYDYRQAPTTLILK